MLNRCRLHLGLLAIALAFPSCADDVTTPPPGSITDPDLPGRPCDTAAAGPTGSVGMMLGGSGFKGFVVDFSGSTPTLDPDFVSGALAFSVAKTVSISGADSARMRLEIRIPTFTPGAFAWGNRAAGPVGDSASVRLEVERGANRVVFLSTSGTTRLQNFNNSPFTADGTFCGFLRDSLSNARVGVMGGKFSYPP